MMHSTDYNDDNIPSFFLNYEYYSLAWGKKHRGYFLDPVNGLFMEYENPYDWYFFMSSEKFSGNCFWGYEKDGVIHRKLLFSNIRRASQKTIPPTMHPMDLNKIEADLDASGFDDSGGACDMGVTSYTLLIYDPTKDVYRRKILKTKGDSCLTSKSSYTQELLSYFK
jgi:hypothetical protein